MQHELDTTTTARAIHLLGVNAAGEESGNSLISSGRTIPWLQDTPAVHVWTSWGVTYRDVVVLDRLNRVISVYNLTSHDLAEASNYAELRTILLDAAR
jgi:hypothetical protein